MMSHRLKINRLSREMVMVIILPLIFTMFIGCDQDEKVEGTYKLPDTFNHPVVGKVVGITPMNFIDTLNNGAMGEVYYFKDSEPEDPADVVYVPGMKFVYLGEMTQILDTLKSLEPIYLISLYGSDARKIAQMNTAKGITFYYVVGGGYKLAELIRQQRLEILPRPQMGNRGK